jgi:hypothetical protein
MSSGGRREGAGRKKVLTYETTVIKIPLPVKDLLKSIVDYEISYLNQNGGFDLDNRYQTDSSNHNQTDSSNHNQTDSSNHNQLAQIKAIVSEYESKAHPSSVRWDVAKKLITDLKKALS